MAEASLKPPLLNAPAIKKLTNQLKLMSQTGFSIGPYVSAELVKLPDRRLIHGLLELGAERDDLLFHPEKFVVFVVAVDPDVEGLWMKAEQEHGKSTSQSPPELRAGTPTKFLLKFIESSK